MRQARGTAPFGVGAEADRSPIWTGGRGGRLLRCGPTSPTNQPLVRVDRELLCVQTNAPSTVTVTHHRLKVGARLTRVSVGVFDLDESFGTHNILHTARGVLYAL